MTENSVMTHRNVGVLSVEAVDAPEVVTSAWIDEQLADTYERTGLKPGTLSDLAGIEERRWWPDGFTFDQAAALAGQAALDAAGIDPQRVGMLISTSVCKHHLEPSVACAVHHQLQLGPSCLNFDVGNACLGFINGMQIAAAAIDAGSIDYALIVDGEGSRHTQLTTIERLQAPSTTLTEVFDQFASLTLGSGAAAMVMGPPREAGHAFLGGVTRAATQHHDLCVGDLDRMRTDTAALLVGGLDLARDTLDEAMAEGWKWLDCDRYVMHQVSSVHTSKLCELLGIDPAKAPLTYPEFGNIGPAAVPYTLSTVADELRPGDRVLLMGIGSGLNCSVVELVW